MGFSEAKRAVVAALREGNFEHEAREALAEKNLLAVGDVDGSDVAELVLKTRSEDYRESPHRWDQSMVVHTFTPTVREERWYIKVYFLETDGDDRKAMFISVHRTGN
ncbi:MAG: hypothetical protein OXG58_01290 [Gemmatimonadetes bacterium]|nr:hypothetical protein [Gemmatimonadota bacterium]MCY3943553.1 hypothetical protein [Gemmatimonadota bacterium]